MSCAATERTGLVVESAWIEHAPVRDEGAERQES